MPETAVGEKPRMMKAWEATIEVLQETGNQAVMWGDLVLLHQIAHRLGWDHEGSKTERRVLAALSKTPGPLLKKCTRESRGRLVRVFRLPEPAQ